MVGAVAARIVSREGGVLLSSDPAEIGRDLSGDPVFRAALERSVIGVPRLVDGRFLVEVAAPSRWIDATRGTIGVVVLTLDATALAKALRLTTGLGQTGEVLLGVREGGQIRFLFPPRYREERLTVPQAVAPALAAATEGREFFERTRDYGGQAVLAAGRPVGYGGWGLVAKMDEAEAYAPIARALRYGLGIGAIIALGGLAAAFGLARYGLAVGESGTAARLGRGLGKVTHGCALAVALTGLVVLAGWALKIELLTTLLPGLVSMKPNTALGFVLAGLALELRHRSGFRLGCALAVIVIGGLSLAQEFSGADFGTDQLLFREAPGAVQTPHPGRMSAISAINFVLLGGALLLLGTARPALRRTMEALALAAGLAALLALVGYAYGSQTLYQLVGYSSIALNTALAFALLAAGILSARADGLAGLLASAGLGGRVARRFLPLAIIGPPVIGSLVLLGGEGGFFSPQQTTVVFGSLMVLVLALLVWWNALALGASDAERTHAEEQIRMLNRDLEQRVADRTTELSRAVDALQREAAERRLVEDSLQKMRFSVDRAGDSIFWISREGRILYANDSACADRSYSHEELLGMSIFDLDPDYQPGVWGPHFEDLKRRGTITLETRHRTKDGRVFPVEVNANYVQHGGEEFNFAFLRDITLRKQAEEQLRQQADELAARARLLTGQNAEVEQARLALEEKAAELALTSRYKSEFLANMSHELRTPLNSILIFSQQLAENKAANLTAKQVEFSRYIHSSGQDLLNLISDILDHSKIESGTVSVAAEEIAFDDVCKNIARDFRHVAEAKGLPFHVSFVKDLPPSMESDPKRLQQILKNLISNAMKFTAHGKVEVRVDLATQGWSPDHPVLSQAAQVVAFAVEDSGIGIAPDKQRLIFEAFQQADAGTARSYGGTGLGLAISRELAMLLGGEIRLASVEGEGSTFTLYLPLHYAGPVGARAAPPEARAPTALRVPHRERIIEVVEKPAGIPSHRPPDEALRGRKVLVVDDDARNIFALVSLLESQEMEVLAATKGRAAIEILRQTPDIALVLMDIMMPGMDGYETMCEIRQLPAHRNLPILALTAKVMKGDREKCLDVGASDYVAKPVNTDQLLSLMRVWLVR